MTAMCHQVNVRKNARETIRVKDKERERESQRHRPTHSKAFAPTPTDIYLHNARHLSSKFTHLNSIAHQDPPWHKGFPTFYFMITPKLGSIVFFPFPAQITLPTSPWPRHECHTSPTTTKDIYPCSQRHLPSQTKAFASTTQGICLQNSRTRTHLPPKTRRDMESFRLFTPWSHQTHLPTHSKAFAPTIKVFASTTQGICRGLQNAHTERHLPAKTRRHMKVFQLFTPWSHQN